VELHDTVALVTGASGDIAAATVMLCRADTVTGQTLVVDGGMPGSMNFG
jgi:NAD(P)-dependent dehydrogenase (short-subunit alcohol dehydrogenase family)